MATKKVGITGQNGFLGYHVYQTLKLYPNEFQVIEFDRTYFDDEEKMDTFTSNCDVIVHLAAVNRHPEEAELYRINIDLTNKLIASLSRTKSKPHIILSSSSQEERDNLYGQSKREVRLALATWANSVASRFTGMIIPNVFGPFGQPFYNSVVATFCHQVSHNETPQIHIDGHLKLIYVGEVVHEIIHSIRTEDNTHDKNLAHTAEAKVSEILAKIQYYKEVYQEKGEFPVLSGSFDYQLFNTFRCYMNIENYFPRKYVQHADNRGVFVEIARLGISGQVSYSTTVPGITRGNHFHTRKIERFSVIKGKALIQLRKIGTEETLNFYLDGNEAAYVDMPIWYTHNIKNIGEEVLYTIFWINEPFDPADPDTYFEVV